MVVGFDGDPIKGHKPLLCAYSAGVNAGGFAIGGLKSFKYYSSANYPI